MGKSFDDDEIECRIIESYGIFSQGVKFWNKEINLVSWNGRPPKLDIRNWQRDHEKCGKGITLTREEAEELVRLLNEVLKKKPGAEKSTGRAGSEKAGRQERADKNESTNTKSRASSKAGNSSGSAKTGTSRERADNSRRASHMSAVPAALEPYYNELGLLFGADPDKCKSARNTLLKKYHPDKNASNIEFATRKTIKIKDAYERILDWWNENTR